MTDLAIHLDRVHKRFGNVHALRGADLKVPRGSIFALIGPNGAGKTTLFGLCCGFLRPDQGAVQILGGAPEVTRLKGRLAALPQDAVLGRDISVREHLVFLGRLQGMDLATAQQDLTEARRQLAAGLEGYGLSGEGAADLEPAQIRAVLEQRTMAGRFARKALALQEARTLAASAGTTLDHLLCKLGFDDRDGDLAGRLERAIASVEAARSRRRAAEATRSRDELEAEIAALADEVARHRRLTWDLTPDPVEPPADPAELMDRRREVAEQVAARRTPDLGDLQRRGALAADRVRALEGERTNLDEGPTALRRRVATAAILCGMFVAAIELTIVGTAMPRIAGSLSTMNPCIFADSSMALSARWRQNP